jgi:Phage tail assembly chaperone protein, TAC
MSTARFKQIAAVPASSDEFEVGGNLYRARKLNAFDAYDVARKWSYVFLTMAKAENLNPQTFAKAFVPFTAPVPKADNDFALELCLQSVQRKSSGDKGWFPIRVEGQMRYDDIGMMEMLEIVYHVIMLNKMIDFFEEPASILDEDEAGKAE